MSERQVSGSEWYASYQHAKRLAGNIIEAVAALGLFLHEEEHVLNAAQRRELLIVTEGSCKSLRTLVNKIDEAEPTS